MWYTVTVMEKKQWFEKENFWLNYGPIMFDQQHWAEAPGIAQAIFDACTLSPGAKVLDAGCGPGRISVELALLGLDVTGVDLMQPYLDAARETAKDENVQLNLIQGDLRTFSTQGTFDVAVNLYTSFGYCDSIQEDQLILNNIAQSVKKGGYFVMEGTSREIAVRYFTSGEWFERAGKTVLTEFSVEGLWEGLRSKWILINNETGERIEHEFVQRLYSAVELRDMLFKAGFTTIKVYGDFQWALYDEKASTMVIICQK